MNNYYVQVSGQYGTPSEVDCYGRYELTNQIFGGNIGVVIREVSATLTFERILERKKR